MIWYYRKEGAHIKVKCYINGALAGELTFRDGEFYNFTRHYQEQQYLPSHPALITFVNEDSEDKKKHDKLSYGKTYPGQGS